MSEAIFNLSRCRCGRKADMRYLPEMGVHLIGCEACKDCLGADTAQRAIELWNEKQVSAGADEPMQTTTLAAQANRAADAFRKFGEAIFGKVEEPEFPNEQELEPLEITPRGVIATILIVLGALFLLGAVGGAEFSGIVDVWYYLRIAFGFALVGAGSFVALRKGRQNDENDD